MPPPGERLITPDLRMPLGGTPTGYIDGGVPLPEAALEPRPGPPPTVSGWYRVFVANRDWRGDRYGVHFERGEAVVHASQKVIRPLSGARGLELQTIQLLVQELGYEAVPIPVGVPPIPSWQLEQVNLDLPVPAGDEV